MAKQNKYIKKVFIDTREQEFRKKSIAFFKTKGVEAELKTLGDYGDVAIFLSTGQWLNVERKSMPDFINSYISGHLQDQAIRMYEASQNPVIIVYGSLKDLKPVINKYPALKHIKQSSVDKMMRTIQVVYRIPVFFVEKEAHYFLEIMNIIEILAKKSGESMKKKQNAIIKNRPDVNLLIIADKVGEKTALLLLKEFKTPEKVLNASRQDLLAINGIGEATVADIKALKKIFYEGML